VEAGGSSVMNGKGYVMMMRCSICGSPIFDYVNTTRRYCDSSTGCDCQHLVYKMQCRAYQRRRKYERMVGLVACA